jgi:hypothetical protein
MNDGFDQQIVFGIDHQFNRVDDCSLALAGNSHHPDIHHHAGRVQKE